MGIDEAPPRVRRKRTARFIEIAEKAGVSKTTVDRVLNERGTVSEATRLRVISAARSLVTRRLLPDSTHGSVHIDIILPRNNTPFFTRLTLALQRSIQMLDKRIIVHRNYVEENDEWGILDGILHPSYRRKGLIITAPDTPKIREALRGVIHNGEPVIAMVTDIPDIEYLRYSGIDNYSAGRTAGYVIGRMADKPGRILLLCSRSDYRAHMDRMRGCRDVISENFPDHFCENAMLETYDNADRCYLAVTNAFQHHDDIVGIYNGGAGTAGINAALRRFNRAGQVIWVTHEITDEHRQYLADHTLDLTIDQNPDGIALWAIQHMLYSCGIVDQEPPANGTNEFRLYFSENSRVGGRRPADNGCYSRETRES